MRLLLYLEFRQFINYITMTLRTPKRLIPFILMIIWFLMAMLPRFLMPHHHAVMPPFPGTSSPQVPAFKLPEVVPAVLFFIISLAMVFQIVKSFSESLIVFGLDDIDFLFPAPVSRRAIMTLKLLGLYTRVGMYVVLGAIFFAPQLSLFFHGTGSIFIAWLSVSLFAAFLVNICTVINLVSTFRPGGKWWLPAAVRGAAMGLLLLVLGSTAYIGMSTGNYAEGALQALTSPLITTLLLPARWTADLVLSMITGWQPALGEELAMMALLAGITYGLVITRKENPYEPSLGISARAARIRAARRQGGLFRIQTELSKSKFKSSGVRSAVTPFGRGAIALIWKSLNISVRNSRSVWIGVPIIVAVLLIASRIAFGVKVAEHVEMIAGIALGYAVFISSMLMLQAFRADLKMANILKPMPIPSWQIIAAQCVQGAIMVTTLCWTVVILVGLVYGLSPNSLLVLAALSLPMMTYALLAWQAAASIIYPKWEDPTQQYLGSMIGMAGSAIAIGPPIVAGVVGHLLHLGVVPTASFVNFAAIGMAALGILISGYLYSRFDPTDE